MLKFCCFNPMPWPRVSKRPEQWPFPNCDFDAAFAQEHYRTQIEQLVFAESCGFDWVGVGEDHMTAWGLTPNPNLILAILAWRTRHVKIAILGAPLPLLNPLRVAEECAMLDVLSGGRLVVGFIRGVPQNYAAYGFEPNESRGRFDEASRLIVRAWTDPGIFGWREKYYHFPSVSLWPLPVQKPHPPLIFSANSVESAIIGAQQRAMIGAIHLYNRNHLGQVGDAISAYKAQARTDGWEPREDRFLVGLQTCIADTDDEAQQLLAPALDYQFNVLSGTYNDQKKEIEMLKPGYGHTPVETDPPSLEERLANRIVICGSPRTVIDQITYLREHLGVGIISLHFQVGALEDSSVRRGMQLFHDCVLPNFRGPEQTAEEADDE